MFGAWAFLLDGNLLCGARSGSLMLRVGPENESWALAIPGVVPVHMRGRVMRGYVRANTEAYVQDDQRLRLLNAAIEFTLSLPGSSLPERNFPPLAQISPGKRGCQKLGPASCAGRLARSGH